MRKPLNGVFDDTNHAPMFSTLKEMKSVLQDPIPPSPRPKPIKHVVLDADDTIWEIEPWSIASLSMPIGKTDKDVLPVQLDVDGIVDVIPEWWGRIRPTGSVRLDPTLRATLQELKKRGIPVSIASSNTKSSVMAYLEAFGLVDSFVQIEAGLGPSKSDMVKKISKKQKVDTAEMLFVNDNRDNVMDVAIDTDATTLIKGFSIMQIDEILEFLE